MVAVSILSRSAIVVKTIPRRDRSDGLAFALAFTVLVGVSWGRKSRLNSLIRMFIIEEEIPPCHLEIMTGSR